MTTLNTLKITVVGGGTKYVELQTLDGILQTVVFEKNAEPNHFKAIEIVEGDHFDDLIYRHHTNDQNTEQPREDGNSGGSTVSGGTEPS